MKRRKYLNRVSVIILSLVFIPVILLTVYFWQRSTSELDKSNQAYYDQIVRSFAADFEERLADLQSHAITVALDSKTDKSVFHEGVLRAQEHAYWYYKAVHEMQDLYTHYNASNCGVYYYDLDRAITTSGILTHQFFLYGLDMRDPAHHSWDFFNAENYRLNNWVFGSTYTGDGRDFYLLAGYCTELGKHRDKVLIVYTISPDDFTRAQSAVYGCSGINFHILDETGEKTYLIMGANAENDPECCRYRPKWLPLTFEIHITENFMQTSSRLYYRDIELMLMILGFTLIVICCLSIMAVYKPVFTLASTLDNPDRETDELGNIQNALENRRTMIMEQENLILDLLLRHMIHGVPISQKMINRLGIDPELRHYCVFVITGQTVPASIFQLLADIIERLYSSRIFCTNWQGENRSVLILFTPETDVTPMEKEMKDWLQQHCGDRCTLLRGDTVDRLDDIRKSFLSCLQKDKQEGEESVREDVKTLDAKDKQQELKTQILSYLEKHFRNKDLGQVKVADAFEISTYTLSRLFKNQVGIGFTEYINSKRLEYARDLLLTTSLSIKEISLQSGYTSETYFGRIFKATYGVSPSLYREQ